jgi:hypothetical protein
LTCFLYLCASIGTSTEQGNIKMSKTLSKKITSQFFATDGGYDTMRQRWSDAFKDKETRKTLTASHHLFYLMLRGKDLSKSFTPITKQIKLDNGARPHAAAEHALRSIWSFNYTTRTSTLNPEIVAMFGDLFSTNIEEIIKAIQPKNISLGQYEYTVDVKELSEAV